MTDIRIGATVIDPGGLQSLIDALVALEYQVLGPTVQRGRHRVCADHAHLGAAGRLDRPPGGRPLSIGEARRRGVVRLRGRPAIVEEVSASSGRTAMAGPPHGRHLRGRSGAPGGEDGVPRRARLRVERHRRPGQGVPGRGSHGRRLCGPPPRQLHRGIELRRGGRDLLLRIDGHRPEGGSRLRSRADRIAAAPPRVPGRGGQRTRRGAPRADSPSRGLAGGRRGGGGRGGGHGGPHGPQARHAGHPGAAAGEPRAPALERGGRAVLELRELHHGLPHLLLHHGARITRISPIKSRCGSGPGIPASRSISPISTAAACASRRGHATDSG